MSESGAVDDPVGVRPLLDVDPGVHARGRTSAPGIAVVTGASSGLGAAFARALAARGHALVLVARDEARLRLIAGQLLTAVEVLVADLTDREQLRRVEMRLADRVRPVDLLVNNAGAGSYGNVAEHDPDALTREVDLNVLAVVRLTRAVLPGLLERGAGGVLNVSSTASTGVAPCMASYAASKAFVDSWSRSLAENVRGTGVTVTCVRPGYTRTEFHRRAGQDVGAVPHAHWLGPDQVVREALAALDADAGSVTIVARERWATHAGAVARRRVMLILQQLQRAVHPGKKQSPGPM